MWQLPNVMKAEAVAGREKVDLAARRVEVAHADLWSKGKGVVDARSPLVRVANGVRDRPCRGGHSNLNNRRAALFPPKSPASPAAFKRAGSSDRSSAARMQVRLKRAGERKHSGNSSGNPDKAPGNEISRVTYVANGKRRKHSAAAVRRAMVREVVPGAKKSLETTVGPAIYRETKATPTGSTVIARSRINRTGTDRNGNRRNGSRGSEIGQTGTGRDKNRRTGNKWNGIDPTKTIFGGIEPTTGGTIRGGTGVTTGAGRPSEFDATGGDAIARIFRSASGGGQITDWTAGPCTHLGGIPGGEGGPITGGVGLQPYA